MKIISNRGLARGSAFQLLSIRDKFPRGLTFFKNFANIPAGVYAAASFGYLLNADFALGSPVATITSTDGNFTIANGGYNATTANDDVLKYLISGNRTAAQETIVIKFSVLSGNFANDGIERWITCSDTKVRGFRKSTTGTAPAFRPNTDDSPAVVANASTVPLLNTTYTFALVCQHSSPYAQVYLNGVSEGTYTTGDFVNPAWGTNFYLGVYSDGSKQGNIVVTSISIFNRPLSASDLI